MEEIATHERSATDATARTHWQVIRLIGQGYTSQEVAAICGFTAAWVRELVRRYNAKGIAAIGDQRQHNQSGQDRRLLSAQQESTLRARVEADFALEKYWSGADLAREMSRILQRPIHRTRGWELLKRWEMKQLVPRPRHAKADPEKQERFKKNIT